MKALASCLLGFVVGWGLRALFDSGREVVVSLGAAAYGAAETARKYAAFEREYFEDLVAEGKARWQARRQRPEDGSAASAQPADDPPDGRVSE